MDGSRGWEALAEAVRTGDVARVRELVADDAGLKAAHAPSGESAVLLAVYHGQDEVAQWLAEAGAPLDLHEAAALGLSDRVAVHLAAQSQEVDAYSFDGWTPLHLAAFFGRTATVEMLLAAGAATDLLARNPQANLPLHAATAARRVDVVAVLLRHGCDVNSRTAGGWTPLHLAAHGGYTELVDLFIEHGAALESRNADGVTPYDLAIEQGRSETAARLRVLGAAGRGGSTA
jgi:ankyrin repeat protein